MTDWRGVGRQLLAFTLVGAAATVAFLVLYNLLRLVLEPFSANAGAVAGSVVVNFAANRRFTFGHRGRERWFRHAGGFLAVFAATYAASSGALAALFALRPAAGRLEENLAVLVGSGLLFIARFWLLRSWVFTHRS